MAARKTKLTVDWIVTTTCHGSEAGGDPMDRSIGHAHFLVYGILVVSMSGLV